MRIDRMLSIVVILLNRRKITAKELAQRFEVSLRTIYRDIESINLAGIPVISIQGTGGGYEIPENFKFSRQYVSHSDLKSIISALKGMNAAVDDQEIELILEKVQSLLPVPDNNYPGKTEEIIVFDTLGWGKSDATAKKIQQCYDAIKNKSVIQMSYVDGNGNVSERTIEPMTIVQKGFSWYLYGFCRKKKDTRLFKLPRMRKLKTSDIFFDRKISRYLDKGFQWDSKETSIDVVLKFSTNVRHVVEEYYQDSEIILENTDFITIKLTVPDSQWLISTILSFGPMVEVLSPLFLRKKIQDQISILSSLYQKK